MTGPVPDATTVPETLRVVVRPLPKVVFFYMTWIVSAICALWPEEGSTVMAQIWLTVFFFNTLVISFDFNEERSVIFLLVGITAVLGLLYFGILGAVSAWFLELTPSLNRTFYSVMFFGFTLIFLFVCLKTRFDYWEFRPNEVVHRHGIFPKMKRYSTEDMRWDKTVPDVLERLLLGTGSIVLTTPHETHPVVLDHVMRIGKLDDQIANILGVKQVVHKPT